MRLLLEIAAYLGVGALVGTVYVFVVLGGSAPRKHTRGWS